MRFFSIYRHDISEMSKKQNQNNSLDPSLFPSAETLNRLAISENGFVFDPSSGDSFTVNPTGLIIIELLKKQTDAHETIKQLQQEFDVAENTAKRDLLEFARTLREW